MLSRGLSFMSTCETYPDSQKEQGGIITSTCGDSLWGYVRYSHAQNISGGHSA